jgi:hypothetical protein
MRANEFLTEEGLQLAQLRKHGGAYFDKLIDKISKGEALEVEANYADRFPNGVIIDPQEIEKLQAAFYPGGDKGQMTTDSGNNVIVAIPSTLREPVKIKDSDDRVPLGAITKTKDFKSGKGINMGIIAEAVLGAALTAKFKKKNEDVDIVDVGRVLGSMTPEPIGDKSSSVMGVYETTISHNNGYEDQLKFVLKLSKNEFSPLVGSIKAHEKLDPQILGIMRSAINYVNSDQAGISAAIEIITNSTNNNTITVISDGISDARGTKADLVLRLNGENIKLISLKAMGVKQFGQVSGHRYENFNNFISDLFDVDITKHSKNFTNDVGIDAARTNHQVMSTIYRDDIVPAVTAQLEGGPESEAEFIRHLTKGIVKHASGDQELDMVKFDRGLKGGFKVLKVDSNLLDKMKKVKFKVEAVPDRAKIRIFGKTSDPELVKELGTSDWSQLLQLRSALQGTVGYVRNILEMGNLLEALTTIQDYKPPAIITPKKIQKIKDLAVGRIVSPDERDERDPRVPDTVALGRAKKK